MNNQQKADLIAAACHRLQAATIANSSDKLPLKLKLRDVIESALLGTRAEPNIRTICNTYVPLCLPFDAQNMLDLAEEWRHSDYLPNLIQGKAFIEQLGV
ncbi:hypothetical protein [Pseudomonas versuta]|uniref:Uncharacterized protein n=1 Tax=Pseudomonas versuta TaxID=1788301 RepID=A0ABX3E7I5_9PSED|nr:hypothetical protein [Pseudomonas versuta]ALE88040.1 hypothetical protein AOC04_07415 [Pseudomonas versuta]OKA20776.1 hypothetical protein BOH73_13145 [Pseudomonas versuta]